jgi:hypothetical protein
MEGRIQVQRRIDAHLYELKLDRRLFRSVGGFPEVYLRIHVVSIGSIILIAMLLINFVHSVYGKSNDSIISGAFVIRGQDYVPAFDVSGGCLNRPRTASDKYRLLPIGSHTALSSLTPPTQKTRLSSRMLGPGTNL